MQKKTTFRERDAAIRIGDKVKRKTYEKGGGCVGGSLHGRVPAIVLISALRRPEGARVLRAREVVPGKTAVR